MIAWAILIAEFGLAIDSIFFKRANDYTINEIFLTKEEVENTQSYLGDFKDSANFFFGLDVGDIESTGIDILNNPYVEFIGYSWNISTGLQNYYEIELCSKDYTNMIV